MKSAFNSFAGIVSPFVGATPQDGMELTQTAREFITRHPRHVARQAFLTAAGYTGAVGATLTGSTPTDGYLAATASIKMLRGKMA